MRKTDGLVGVLDSLPTMGLAEVPGYAQGALGFANQRFLAIHQFSKTIPFKQILVDRSKHVDLYDPFAKETREIDDERRIEFMHRVTGFKKDVCTAWLYMDYARSIEDGEVALDVSVPELIWEAYENALALTEGTY